LVVVSLPVLSHAHCLRKMLLDNGWQRNLERVRRSWQVVMMHVRMVMMMLLVR
tara:strand:+ start:4069 stop:4227 length:159 start_codon:yes stop_codon:yes gene_type:complete